MPSVTITTTPVSSFHEGVALSITCLVELHPSVDSPVSVRGRWLHNRTQLQNSSSGNGLMFTNNFTSTPPYTINISFDPVTLADSGVYSCEANVVPQNVQLIREPERLATNLLTVYVQGILMQLCHSNDIYHHLCRFTIAYHHCSITTAICLWCW